jgi:hypothetical protein
MVREYRQVLYSVTRRAALSAKIKVAAKYFELKRNGGMSEISFNMKIDFQDFAG